MTSPTLGDLLRARNLLKEPVRALRVTLHPLDRSSDFPSLASVVAAGHLAVYARMQEGFRLGPGGPLLLFAAEPRGRARLGGFVRTAAKRKGVVPGDIVYDYDAAPLLHAFIARSRHPVFYDVVEEPGMDDLVTALVVAWPQPMRFVRAADDPSLEIV